ncbi:MAG TPA: BrnT family toxin [Terriglobia bacterium]|nr:BrnT family toxin [Terriglobia bacterium]
MDKETVFRWHPKKERSNLRKHGVTFEEAASVFRDALSLTITDPLHSDEEDRLVTIGQSAGNKTLVVVHLEVGDEIRIISARTATPSERRNYEEGTR